MKILEMIAGILLVLWELAEFLAVPAVIVAVGLFFGFSWQYYVAAIGAYVLIWLLIELLGWLIGSVLGRMLGKAARKKYEPRFLRKLRAASQKRNNHN